MIDHQNETSATQRTSLPLKIFYTLIVVAAVIVAVYSVTRSGMPHKGNDTGQPSGDSLADLRKTDPKLIKYQEVGTIKTGFMDARGIAVGPDNHVYAVGDRKIRVFGLDGSLKSEIPLKGNAECVAVDNDGTIYTGLLDHVELFLKDGSPSAVWESLGPRAFITSIAVTTSDVFVADAGGRVVLRYDKSGAVVKRIGEKDEARNVPGLVIPSHHCDVAMAPDGLLRVVNPGRHRIEAYTLDGDLEQSWGRSAAGPDGFPGCCNPTDIAILANGDVVASDKGLFRVKSYRTDGEFIGMVAGTESFEDLFVKGDNDNFAGIDLAVLGDRILVLDPSTGTVRIYARSNPEKPTRPTIGRTDHLALLWDVRQTWFNGSMFTVQRLADYECGKP